MCGSCDLMLTSQVPALPGWDEGQGGGSQCGAGRHGGLAGYRSGSCWLSLVPWADLCTVAGKSQAAVLVPTPAWLTINTLMPGGPHCKSAADRCRAAVRIQIISITDTFRPVAQITRRALPTKCSTDASKHEDHACLADEAQVAIFDATNSTESRRQLLVSRPCMQGLPAWHACGLLELQVRPSAVPQTGC